MSIKKYIRINCDCSDTSYALRRGSSFYKIFRFFLALKTSFLGRTHVNLNTLALFVREKELNIIGACIGNKKTKGIDFSYLKYSIKKEGLVKVFSQIVQRMLYKVLNSKKDQKIHARLFKEDIIKETIDDWQGAIHYTNNYQNNDTLNWIEDLRPDLIVVHTPYWVGKKIRDIVEGNVIGGHPGITPYY